MLLFGGKIAKNEARHKACIASCALKCQRLLPVILMNPETSNFWKYFERGKLQDEVL